MLFLFFSFFVRERVMEFDWRCLFARPRASWSPQTHRAWAGPAGLWAAEAWGARQALLGMCWVPSDLAVRVVSGGMKHARDGIQRALENYPRGFQRSAMWAEDEMQLLKKAQLAHPPGRPGRPLLPW